MTGTGQPTPQAAMVLAAGLGTRMRPLTNDRPKPLVKVAGHALIDRVLDRLADAGVKRAVVNTHYLAGMLTEHLASRTCPKVVISDETEQLLDTGGGIAKALPLLGAAPFYLSNADTIWIEGAAPLLDRLAGSWDPTRMDALLALAPTPESVGYFGYGDFDMDGEGRITRRQEGQVAPFVYTGTGIVAPDLFCSAPHGAFSLNLLFDRAIEHGRLFGLRLEGLWMHVGTPAGVEAAEKAIATSAP